MTMNLKQIQITTYQITKEFIMKEKLKKRGCGVLMYIRNDLTNKIRNDLCISDGDREIVTIELPTKSIKSIIVSCCYKLLVIGKTTAIICRKFSLMPQRKTNFTLLQEILT